MQNIDLMHVANSDIKSNYWYELSEKFGFKIIKKNQQHKSKSLPSTYQIFLKKSFTPQYKPYTKTQYNSHNDF